MISSYKTITNSPTGVYKEKGSRFLAFAFKVETLEEIKEILEKIKKEHFSARHVCYAYKIGDQTRACDDGEPSSTAGKPILGQIVSHDLDRVLVVVVRYFGGVLLGTGGLTVAYRSAAASALDEAQIVVEIVKEKLQIAFSYALLPEVMNFLKNENLEISSQNFSAENVEMNLNIPLSIFEKVSEKLLKLEVKIL